MIWGGARQQCVPLRRCKIQPGDEQLDVDELAEHPLRGGKLQRCLDRHGNDHLGRTRCERPLQYGRQVLRVIAAANTDAGTDADTANAITYPNPAGLCCCWLGSHKHR